MIHHTSKFQCGTICHIYEIMVDNNTIARVLIVEGTNYIEDVWVKSEYRRKGLARKLYSYIQCDLNITLVPSKEQTKMGKFMWKLLD